MRQLFAPGADAIFRLFLFSLAGLVVFGAFVLAGYANSQYAGAVAMAPAQPVPFSHKHHVGQLGIDCRNCHQTVETQATAGMPPTHTCMTCHSQIWTQAKMLEPVRQSLATNTPLEWTRVNHLPEYVYFNHSIHIVKGVGCSSCHGTVDRMQLTFAAKNFTMAFCLTCHSAPQKYVRPASEIWNMEWSPPSNQASLGAALVKQNHIIGAARLTDCSTCHR
jgi:hypothetical protein